MIQDNAVHRPIFKIKELFDVLTIVIHLKLFMIVKCMNVIARYIVVTQRMLNRRRSDFSHLVHQDEIIGFELFIFLKLSIQ